MITDNCYNSSDSLCAKGNFSCWSAFDFFQRMALYVRYHDLLIGRHVCYTPADGSARVLHTC